MHEYLISSMCKIYNDNNNNNNNNNYYNNFFFPEQFIIIIKGAKTHKTKQKYIIKQ